ncbi:MAG: DUF1801 domain-containing protein [Flavobacteriales bacterium]
MSSIAISPDVDNFIADSKHSLASCLQPLRELIHEANSDVTEQIKWKCPSFCLDGDDRITYNLSKKDQLLVIFHTGAKGKGKTPDKSKFSGFEFLEWLAPDRAVVKIANQVYLFDISKEMKKCISLWLRETK